MVDGKFHVKRRLDGSVLLRLTPNEFVVSPMHAVQIAKAILREAGVETIMADPGQTVIRAPKHPALDLSQCHRFGRAS